MPNCCTGAAVNAACAAISVDVHTFLLHCQPNVVGIAHAHAVGKVKITMVWKCSHHISQEWEFTLIMFGEKFINVILCFDFMLQPFVRIDPSGYLVIG